MKDKLLKLAKRLNRFTLADIEPILCCDNLENILQELVSENLLKFSNGNYFYVKKSKLKKELPNFFQFHTQDEIDMIIKCFCADIETEKGAFLIGISDATLQKFNMYFRKMIYEQQLNTLKKCFERTPKFPKMRTFYDIPVYFYLYDNELFVTDKPLKSKNIIEHSKEEKLRIKVLYSRLRRSIDHSRMKKFITHHVAEHIWKYGKNFGQLKNEIHSLLF